MVKGKTTSGIKFQIDERIKDDARLLYLLTLLQKEDTSLAEKGQLVFELLGMVFGNDGIMPFMDEVAKKNKGICSTEAMMRELNEIFDAINAKNL